jgi:hypothetical protein
MTRGQALGTKPAITSCADHAQGIAMPKRSFAARKPATQVAATLLFAASILGFMSAPSHAAIHCGGDGYCSCSGEEDCNRMFTDLCTGSGGQCTGSGDTAACTCNQKANIANGNPRHPILTPPRFPIHGPVRGRPVRGTPIKGMPIYSKPIITHKPIQKSPGSNSTGSGTVLLERHSGKH